MAQRYYTFDLADSSFPLLSSLQPRTTIGTRAAAAQGETGETDPGVSYCHNVMPSDVGYNSIAYVCAVSDMPIRLSDFTDVRIAYGDERTRLYVAWDTTGRIYINIPSSGDATWRLLPVVLPDTTSPTFTVESVTIGTVNGVSYFFYSGIGCFIYDESVQNFVAVTLTGLTIADVLGVASSSGYLIAYTSSAVAWSSTIDPTDFVPDQVTGAGGGNIADIDGGIQFITTNSLGIIIYAQANAVAGTYTGNVQFPWKFRPVEGSGGGLGLDLVAYQSNAAEQFVYTKYGLQSITSRDAKNILPEVTDFLAGKVFEDFNETTLEYEYTNLTAAMKKKIKFIANRYLVISYGIDTFTHALVYDLSLEKLGKLKKTHVDCVEYIGDQTEIARSSLALLSADGSLEYVDFSINNDAASGVLVMGKLQLTHTHMMLLLGVEVEDIDTNDNLSVYTQAALNGKNFTTIAGIEIAATPGLRRYTFKAVAKNHSIVLLGRFATSTLLVRYALGGRR